MKPLKDRFKHAFALLSLGSLSFLAPLLVETSADASDVERRVLRADNHCESLIAGADKANCIRVSERMRVEMKDKVQPKVVSAQQVDAPLSQDVARSYVRLGDRSE